MNIGLLGAGWFGREAHLRNLLTLPDANVVAVSSRSPESRRAAREIAGDELQTFEDWRDVVRIESLDAVIIALTNDLHHAAAMAALQAGLHVLCEKPLGLTIAAVRRHHLCVEGRRHCPAGRPRNAVSGALPAHEVHDR